MRQSTLELLGLGSVLEIFKRGRHPVATEELIEKVFGKSSDRGALVISGANGIVGAGKMVQLGSRLQPYGVTMVGLDFPDAPDGIGAQYPGLQAAFGREQAGKIMSNVVRLNYNGRQLPSQLKGLRPAFLLEAIPEVLEIKKAHYAVFREAFPRIEIRSVTSGFPSSELGVSIAHPAFPHQINKIWEMVEAKPSAVTQLFWSLGMIPVPVSDHWSFVLDVLFCGLTLAGLRYHRAANMPFWKIDKYVRRRVGPNPFRAHDAIGAAGANFLTWSCLHHLAKKYGPLFEPTPELEYRKTSGQDWYPLNHFRPVVDWHLEGTDDKKFESWILGPMIQMTSLLLHENRSHLSLINMIGESCAQFRKGVIALVRDIGPKRAVEIVGSYHRLHPEAASGAWHPEVFEKMEDSQWQQLYVNAEHDGNVGVITIGRESYNHDVDAELNRAIDWLKAEGVERVILSGDFHLSTQIVGADTSEFYPALEDTEIGARIASTWSATARRLNDEFRVSVGFINGKRCLGGMLELMMHCHYLVAVDDASLGMPEVTLPVVPGMEGCHWPFRKARSEDWPQLVELLLGPKQFKAEKAVGWLIDYAGSLDEALSTAWKVATEGDAGPVSMRELKAEALSDIPAVNGLPDSGNPAMEAARKAIHDCIRESCSRPLSEAIVVQARHSAGFMNSRECKKGVIGSECAKIMNV
jgi:enoyl-CoA hydratase/carnithine racemase